MSHSRERLSGRRAAGRLVPAICNPVADVGDVVPADGRNSDSGEPHAPAVVSVAAAGEFGHSLERPVG